MAQYYYDGTSAYKINEYESYNTKAREKQEQKKATINKHHAINKRKLLIVLSTAFMLAAAFLYANVMLLQASSEVTKLTKELEDMKVRNTQVSFDIVSGVDYNDVERKAISEFGMQHPESYQNVYVDVVQSDYAEVSNEKAPGAGVVETLVSGVKSFLAYIR